MRCLTDIRENSPRVGKDSARGPHEGQSVNVGAA